MFAESKILKIGILCSIFVLLLNWGNAYAQVQDEVHTVVWSPDGSMIAISGGVAGCDDVNTSQFAIRIFDASTGQILKYLDGMTCTSTDLDWSPDSQKLVSMNSAQVIAYIWDVSAGNIIRTVQFESQGMLSVLWSPNGNLIASGFPGNGIVIWDPNNGQLVNTNLGGTAVDWSPDSTKVITGSGYNNRLQVYNVSTGDEELLLTGASDVTYSVAWSPEGSRIASNSADNNVRIWNAVSGQLLSTLSIPNTLDVKWSPSGQYIATAGFDPSTNIGVASVWDANTGIQLLTFSENERLYSVSWSPDGNKIAFGGKDGSVEIASALAAPLYIAVRQLSLYVEWRVEHIVFGIR